MLLQIRDCAAKQSWSQLSDSLRRALASYEV